MATRDEILESIANMTVMEVADLIKAMEDKFGVTAAAAAVAVAAPAAAAEEVEDKSEFDVVITGFDASKKIAAIKAVREVSAELGLKEAKELVEGAPKTLKEGVSKEDAEKIKAELVAAGAEADIK